MNNFDQQTAYYINPQPVVIPGLKMAYGAQAISDVSKQSAPETQSKNWLGRLKSTVVNIVTEEAESDRPIGIAQLSRHTFLAHPHSSHRTMVQSSNPLQDYRFRFISDPASSKIR